MRIYTARKREEGTKGINGKERHLRFYRLYGVGVARRAAPKVCHPRRPTETSKAGRSWAKATAEGGPGKTLFFNGRYSSSHDFAEQSLYVFKIGTVTWTQGVDPCAYTP